MKVAYQGEPGAYSEAAIIDRYGSDIEAIGKLTLDDVFLSVKSHEADKGLVPIENSIEGSVYPTYDLLNENNLLISGEHIFRVVHCLLANVGVTIAKINKVYSHPQALGQTRKYIYQLGLEPLAWYDTAGSAKMIKTKNLQDSAAIASKRAAEIYGLEVLAEGIETHKKNFTRFLEIGFNECESTGNDKTTITFTVNDTPEFIEVLQTLHNRKLRVTHIESRSILGRPWEYRFYIDYEGHKLDSTSNKALEIISKIAPNLSVLGSYPRMKHDSQESV